MTFDKIIEIADKAYGEGLVQAAFDFGPHPNGDSLALFIVRELLDVYEPGATDAEQLQEAQRVMLSAYNQVGDVIDAFDSYVVNYEQAQYKGASCQDQSA
jgi:hypothetical protein